MFIVDLETVSFFNQEDIINIASDNSKYYKIPFLYLLSSYVRNQAIDWADNKYTYIEKQEIGSWMIYKFTNKKIL